MNSRQSRKYNAAVSGRQELINHAADFTADTALINRQALLDASIERIERIEARQEADITGYAQSKFIAKFDMSQKAWVIGKLLTVFAREIGDEVLEAEIDFEKTDFLKAKDTESKDRAKLVRDRANTHLAAMTAAGYQITAAMITALSTAITDFETEEGKPRAAEGDTVAATADLDVEFGNLVTVEEDVLDLVVPYALTNPAFYSAVLDAFEVQDIGTRQIAARITVVDDVTNTRLANAVVTAVELSISKNSSRRGIADFSRLEMIEGNYTFSIALGTYQTETLSNTAVFGNKLTRVEVRLKKV